MCDCDDCSSCVKSTTLVISALCLLTAVGIEAIYGGIWWRRLDEIANYVSGRPNKMWRGALAMWILSILVPFIGPWILACILASWTTSSGCDEMERVILKAMEPGASRAESVKEWLAGCEADWGSFDGCFDKLCRGEPHALMVTAAVLGALGVPAFFVFRLWDRSSDRKEGAFRDGLI